MNIRRQLARSSRYRQSSSHSASYRGRQIYRSGRPRALRVAVRTPVTPERTEMAAADQPASAADTRYDRQPAQPGSADLTPARPDAPSAAEASSPATPTSASDEDESTSDLAPETAPHAGEASEEASLVIPRGAMPAPLRGSLASLERQNTKLDAEGLERIEDEDDLSARIAHGLLVPVPVSSGLSVNENLPANHRYCRPWTARFLADLSRAHEAAFHHGFEVSSAVRTVEYQRRLMRINGNAAPAQGDIVSPHLTGATIDIAKQGMSRSELGWMRNHLLALEAAGKIDVEEEFRQSCFHITVYKSYDPARPARRPSEARKPGSGPGELPIPRLGSQPDGQQPAERPQPATGAASDSSATGF
jgi:hypothetical protein